MKTKHLLIIGLAALAGTANFALAQEGSSGHVQTTMSQDGQEVTIVADTAAPHEEIKKALEVAQAARAKSAVLVTQAKGSADAGKSFRDRLVSVISRANPNAASRTLVIPKDAADPKSLAETEEDLNVMAHILEKAVSSDDRTPRAMGIPLRFGTSESQNIYVEGHGAIFLLNVNYPLLPPPPQEGETNAGEKKVNNEWEEARREMAEPGRGGFGGSGYTVVASPMLPPPPGTTVDYDADRVEELKKDTIGALKNAAHIRKLKADETVTVVVSGPGSGDGKVMVGSGGGGSTGGGKIEVITGLPSESANSGSPAAKLIVRAKKSDAEAFLNDKLSFDDFKKKVTVLLY